jgi:hypothetical protein
LGKPITFRTWENNHVHDIHEGITLVEDATSDKTDSADTFGSFKVNSITLTGRVKEAMVIWDRSLGPNIEYNDKEDAHWVRSVHHSLSGEIVGQIAFDSDSNNLQLQHIHCLLCMAREKYGKWQLTCLGLVPTDESKKEFSRVGHIFIRKED